MPTVDITTLFFVLMLVGLSISLMLAIVGKGVDNNLLIWSTAYACQGIGFMLISLRGVIPDSLSIWLGNVLVACMFTLLAVGLLNFLHQRMNPLLVWSPIFMVALAFFVFFDQLSGRIIAGGLIFFVQVLFLLWIVIYHRAQLVGRGKFILAACFTFSLPVSLSRPIATILDFGKIESFNSAGPLQAYTFLAITVISIIAALALVLMQKEQAEEATNTVARRDDLTGLPNRRKLYERICELTTNRKISEFGAVVMLDLDNFKVLNDSHGHAAGDNLLKLVAERLLACVGETDMVARLGGDEFVVLLPALGADADAAMIKAKSVAQKIQAALAEPYQLTIVNAVNTAVNNGECTISHRSTGTLGVKVFRHPGQSREDLLRDADQAMYVAKHKQRGTIEFAPMSALALASAKPATAS
jgi:diguanylate cyclase (GGDEF)-like protein